MNSEASIPAYKLMVDDVYKAYGDKQILENVDLRVREGEFCSVVGPSGCGKSTLLRLILGQEKPDSGHVLIDGRPVSNPNQDRGIVFQKYSLFPNLTVLQNVMMYFRMNSSVFAKPAQSEIDEAMHYLKRVHLQDSPHKYPHELSGGMQQRAAIAQALIAKPKILLMDEPFGALDPHTREDLQLFLLECWKRSHSRPFLSLTTSKKPVLLALAFWRSLSTTPMTAEKTKTVGRKSCWMPAPRKAFRYRR